jgi:hypothetical protein
MMRKALKLDPASPSLTPEYLLAGLTTLVGLFATQGLISNGLEKLITGSAAVLLPLGFLVGQALIKAAHKHAQPAPVPVPAPPAPAPPAA